jgi:translocation and assembly module TamA
MRSRSLLISLLLLQAIPVHAKDKVRIEIDGLDRDLRRNVLATLSLEEARSARDGDDLDEDRIRRLHSRAAEEIETAIQPFGYYRPGVQSTATPGWRATRSSPARRSR